MTVQLVRPAGAGHETLAVLGCALLILLLAGSVVLWRHTPAVSSALPPDQLDARHDLNAAEQGLYADLRVARDEILQETAPHATPPEVATLADLGLPPFVADAGALRRGRHRWSRLEHTQVVAYLGHSGDTTLAGHLLLRLPDHGTGDDASAEPDIWLHRGTLSLPLAALDDAALEQAGWRRVTARFDAGVTRQRDRHAHP